METKQPIKMENKLTKDEVLNLGFKELPHFTIVNALIFELGRNRQLSLGSVATPNEMLSICETSYHNPKEITDVVILHNYDYDGYLTVERLLSIINVLKRKK